jgi:hypothetical protein
MAEPFLQAFSLWLNAVLQTIGRKDRLSETKPGTQAAFLLTANPAGVKQSPPKRDFSDFEN